ncbi:hypothetical protein A9G41_03025 [Gilliamella sp. Nev5-1]|uniref:hypothetical protein n=1 Tax=Gilliamella sp. Nev5-1 TaxID=3120251 RepID=UPI0008290EE9|nr:hypothetical protein [Gilliamella apicola]OCG71289.1 hypothetical protein A9G41_03025 [Gilliamella apicola]
MKKISIFFIILLTSNYVQSLEIIWDLVFDAKYNLAHIPMNIEDEKILLTFDTGAKEALYLPIDLINKIPNKSEQSKKIRYIDLSGNIIESRSYIIENLCINSFNFKKVSVAEYKYWGFNYLNDDTDVNKENKGLDNPVIGLGLFKDYVLTINYPESKITISDYEDISNDLDEKWISAPFQVNSEGLVINMSDGIKNYNMILDSAATTSILKEQSLSPKTTIINNDGSDDKFVSINFNNIINDNIEAVILDSIPDEFQSDGIVGHDFLSKNIVKIDFKNKRLWVRLYELK